MHVRDRLAAANVVIGADAIASLRVFRWVERRRAVLIDGQMLARDKTIRARESVLYGPLRYCVLCLDGFAAAMSH